MTLTGQLVFHPITTADASRSWDRDSVGKLTLTDDGVAFTYHA